MRYFIAIVLGNFFVFIAHSQNNIILKRISEFQVAQKDGIYEKGVFPSQRIKSNKNKVFEDNNIFFTGLILYTLKSLQDSLQVDNRNTIDSIFNNSLDAFKYYKSRDGRISYNFYQIHPKENPFPNTNFLPNSSHRKLADDLDNTSILYLAMNATDSLNQAIKKLMVEYSKRDLYTSTFKEYRKSEVYKTWFAKKKNQDVDICVLSNILLFVFEKKIALDPIDSTSINLIKSSIQQNLHLKKEHLIAPHYQNAAINLYHIARLISTADYPLLNELRTKIINDIHQELTLVDNLMAKVILLSSLFRLGEGVDYEIDFQLLNRDMNQFYWFKASPFCTARFWLKKFVGRSEIFHMLYSCQAYYWSLVLELETLSDASFSMDQKQNTTMYKRY